MTKYDFDIEMAKKNNGIVTTSMVQTVGIARQYLRKLVERDMLERASRGVYVLAESWEDKFVKFQSRFKKGIYSKETALFLHDLSDRTPLTYSMTFPDNYNLSNVKKEGIIASRAKDDVYCLGVSKIKSPAGNSINAYCPEKTLCDILRPRSGVEIGVIAEAFKRYAMSKNKDIPLLSEYSKLLKVEKKVRSYLEVLL